MSTYRSARAALNSDLCTGEGVGVGVELNLCVYALKLVINSLVDRMGGEFNDFNTG